MCSARPEKYRKNYANQSTEVTGFLLSPVALTEDVVVVVVAVVVAVVAVVTESSRCAVGAYPWTPKHRNLYTNPTISMCPCPGDVPLS